MLDKMVDYINSMAQAKAQADSNAIALDISDNMRILVDLLTQNNKINVETGKDAYEQASNLSKLVDATKQMTEELKNSSVDNEKSDLSSLSPTAEQKDMMNVGGKENPEVGILKSIAGTILNIPKLMIKKAKDDFKEAKAIISMEKSMAKANKPGTKVISGKSGSEKDKPEDKKNPLLNSMMIASKMADAASKALNPIKLVAAFLTKVLPIIIIAGLFLYGFFKAWLKEDAFGAILALTATIVTIFAAYMLWKYGKETILFAVKLAFETIKMIAGVSAAWAVVAMFAVMIAIMLPIILVVFLVLLVVVTVLVALIAVALVAALAAIVVMLGKALGELFKVIIDCIVYAVEGLAKIFPLVLDMFKELISFILDIILMIPQFISDLIVGFIEGLGNIIVSIIDTIMNVISSIFGGIAKAVGSVIGGLFGGLFGKKDKKEDEKELKEMTINTLQAQFSVGGALASLIGQGFIEAVHSAFNETMSSIEGIAENFKTSYDETMNEINSVMRDVREMIISQTVALITALIADMTAITGAFLAILLGFPIIGWMMGLMGSNSFSKALEPLVENTTQIKSLIEKIIEGMSAKTASIAKSISTVNNEGTSTTVIDSVNNSVSPIEGAVEMDSETAVISGGIENPVVTSQQFGFQMYEIKNLLKQLVEVSKASDAQKSSGIFSWLW